ncbi:DNA-methyltransferase [Amedibacillus sp. YH-ame6]
MIITDPPYLISKGGSGKDSVSRNLRKLTNELQDIGVTEGIDLSILDEFMRVMKKPNIYIWCNKKQIIPYLEYFVRDKQCTFEILTWIKTNPIPTCGNDYLHDKEYCLYFRKGVKLHTKYETAKTYWITPTNIADKRKYEHPTIKPLWIIEMLLKNSSSPGDVVLDCFLGSGTTGVAAVKNDRQFIGFEINEKFYEIAVERVKEVC